MSKRTTQPTVDLTAHPTTSEGQAWMARFEAVVAANKPSDVPSVRVQLASHYERLGIVRD